MFKKFAKLIIAITLISNIFCAYKDIPDERIFDLDRSNGQTFTVEKDQKFAVLLRGNPTTGYEWFLAEQIQQDELVADDLNENGITKNFLGLSEKETSMGLGGSYYFTFIGKKAGTYPLIFIHKRSWEKEALTVRAATITVTENKN